MTTDTETTPIPVVSPFIYLLRSRKFLIGILDILLQILGPGFGIDASLLEVINTISLTLIGAIAFEDAAGNFKSRG